MMPQEKVRFGAVYGEDVDWRGYPPAPDADRDDDEELPITPPDVVRLLGFDPAREPDFGKAVNPLLPLDKEDAWSRFVVYPGDVLRVLPAVVKSADSRTLYVSRPLLNGDAVRAWAASQGIASALPAGDMHVTIAFSRELVDWSALTPDQHQLAVVAGDRFVHQFPAQALPNGALVLRFSSEALARRWQQLRGAGASWDFPVYEPHITITYSVPAADVADIEPYTGPLVFGPEEFAEVNEEWAGEVVEESLEKAFNPNQPRASAGTPIGGEWTSSGGGASPSAIPSDPSTWKTIQDARDGVWARHHISIARNEDNPVAEAKFVDWARGVDESLTRLEAEYPGIKDYLTLQSGITLDKGRHLSGQRAADAFGTYDSRYGSITVASSLREGNVKLKAGDWAIATSADSVLRHELGHALTFKLRQRAQLDGTNLYAAWDYAKATTAKNLSQYSATNFNEWVAESFAAYSHPEYASSRVKLDASIVKVFDTYLRKKT